jgi:hypothetical protein
MVYKKYIKRGDKIYGPYKYHSHKINGRVISEYHGKHEKKNKKLIFLIIGIIIFSTLMLSYLNFDFMTGFAVSEDLETNTNQLESTGPLAFIRFVIEIISAEHLDENREFISDIYEETKALDGVWSEEIQDGEFVRVIFEQNLTSENDITIYPRIINGNPRIEVYEKDGTEIIAEFTSIISEEYNKVLLTNLQGLQDTFDLLILEGSLQFDYIFDPSNQTVSFFTETYNLDLGYSTCTWANSSDNVYCNNDGIDGGEGVPGWINSTHSIDIPDGSTITEVIACSEFYGDSKVGDDVGDILVIEVGHNETGTLSWQEYLNEEQNTTFQTEATWCFNVTAFINNESRAEHVRIKHTYTEGVDNNQGIYVDFSYVNITYTEPAGDNYPTATLNSPVDYYNTSSNSVIFNGTAYDDINLINVTLYGNWSGGWSENETNNSGINNSFYLFTETIPEGTYVWNYYACDNATSTQCSFATSNRTFTIDLSAPLWFDNSSNGTGAGDYIKHSVRWTDVTNLSGYIFSFDNGTGSFTNDSFVTMFGIENWSNVSKWINTTGGSTIQWIVYSNDTGNYWNATDIFQYTTIADQPPQWSSDVESPADPATYSTSTNYQFNTTWTDDNSVSVVFIEHNFTGTLTNYTVSNLSTVWYYDYVNLSADFYSWRMYANDTLDQWNSTDQFDYTVSQNTESCAVYFNESSVTYPATFRVYTNCTTGFDLTRNGTTIANNSEQILGAGAYNFTVQRTDTANYSNIYNEQEFQVDKATPTISKFLNWVVDNISVIYPTPINASASTTAGLIQIFRNETNITANNNVNVTLAVGYYEYKFNVTGNQNYSDVAGEFLYAEINKSDDSCAVYFNESSGINYPQTFLPWTNCTSSFVFTRNGTTITNNTEQTLAASAYNFTVQRTDTANYSNIYNEQEFQVDKGVGEVDTRIDSTRGNKSVLLYSEKWLNATLINPSSGNIELWYNDTLIENGASPLSNLTNFTGY